MRRQAIAAQAGNDAPSPRPYLSEGTDELICTGNTFDARLFRCRQLIHPTKG